MSDQQHQKTQKRKLQEEKQKHINSLEFSREMNIDIKGFRTASGLPMSLATEEVASERMEEVSTPSRLTLVERLRHGILLHSSSLSLSATVNGRKRQWRNTQISSFIWWTRESLTIFYFPKCPNQ